MAKGYWIAAIDIDDLEQYRKYIVANDAVFAQFGGRFVIRAGRQEVVEGEARTRNVVIEFPSYEAALDCFHSAEYQAARQLRLGAAHGSVVVIEGYEGPQPRKA